MRYQWWIIRRGCGSRADETRRGGETGSRQSGRWLARDLIFRAWASTSSASEIAPKVVCGTAGGTAYPIAEPKCRPRVWWVAGQDKVLCVCHWDVVRSLGGEGASVEVGCGQGHAEGVVLDGVSRDCLWGNVDAPEVVEGVEVDLESRQGGDGGHGEREKGRCVIVCAEHEPAAVWVRARVDGGPHRQRRCDGQCTAAMLLVHRRHQGQQRDLRRLAYLDETRASGQKGLVQG